MSWRIGTPNALPAPHDPTLAETLATARGVPGREGRGGAGTQARPAGSSARRRDEAPHPAPFRPGPGHTSSARGASGRAAFGPYVASPPSNSNAPCSRSRAGATGGGRAGKPRHIRIAFTADGAVTVAMILSRPLHRGHSSTSTLNTRSISSAQLSRATLALPS